MKDITYKLDIREWKETSRTGDKAIATRKLAERINEACKTFTLMHYNQLVMSNAQFKDLAKFWGFEEFEGEDKTKNRFYRTDKGYIMEVTVSDK